MGELPKAEGVSYEAQATPSGVKEGGKGYGALLKADNLKADLLPGNFTEFYGKTL